MAQIIADKHIGHGSHDVYKIYPDKSYVFNFSHAVLIATTSACAVGSLLHRTLLFPSAIIFPSLSVITAPNGPPSLFLNPFIVFCYFHVFIHRPLSFILFLSTAILAFI